MTKFVMSLNDKDISRIMREVEQYKIDFTNKVSRLIETLTDQGVEIAKFQIRTLGAVYTGALESSITGYFNPSVNVGIISAGAPYAIYVEFGTGIVGEASPHPAPGGWVYDINEHGEEGWWYLSRYGRRQWTQGMKSRPFMYNTVRELEQICVRVAKEVFGHN